MSSLHGVGVDLVHLDRFEKFARDHADRMPEMFTAREKNRAAAFAIKEAVLKAIGGLTGWELDWREIEARVDRGGSVEVRLGGAVARHAKKLGVARVTASVVRQGKRLLATAIAGT